jgi:hypothetical protein
MRGAFYGIAAAVIAIIVPVPSQRPAEPQRSQAQEIESQVASRTGDEYFRLETGWILEGTLGHGTAFLPPQCEWR